MDNKNKNNNKIQQLKINGKIQHKNSNEMKDSEANIDNINNHEIGDEKSNEKSDKIISKSKFGNIATMYLKIKYHPALRHMETELRNGVRNILYSDHLNRRMFPDFHIAWLKGDSLGLLLKPSYNNNGGDDTDSKDMGCGPCNENGCKHCEFMVKSKYIQFKKNGHRFRINGNFNCKTKICVYAVQTPFTELWYIGSTEDFRKRKRNAKSNLNCFNPDKPRGCGLVVHLYQLSKILNIDRIELFKQCKYYIIDTIELSTIEMTERLLEHHVNPRKKLSEKQLKMFNLSKYTIETKETIEKKLWKCETDWQLRSNSCWKGLNDWRDVVASGASRRNFGAPFKSAKNEKKMQNIKKLSKYSKIISMLKEDKVNMNNKLIKNGFNIDLESRLKDWKNIVLDIYKNNINNSDNTDGAPNDTSNNEKEYTNINNNIKNGNGNGNGNENDSENDCLYDTARLSIIAKAESNGFKQGRSTNMLAYSLFASIDIKREFLHCSKNKLESILECATNEQLKILLVKLDAPASLKRIKKDEKKKQLTQYHMNGGNWSK